MKVPEQSPLLRFPHLLASVVADHTPAAAPGARLPLSFTRPFFLSAVPTVPDHRHPDQRRHPAQGKVLETVQRSAGLCGGTNTARGERMGDSSTCVHEGRERRHPHQPDGANVQQSTGY